MSGARPPRWLERALASFLPSGLSGEGTLGDLAEEFEQRAAASAFRARLWYAGQAASLMMHRLRPGAAGSSELGTDLRWSLRSIARHPGFALGVVGILGLGLGANTAVFAVVDGTLESTSWWRDADRTVAIWPGHGFSFGQLGLYRESTSAYETVGAYSELAFSLRTADGESQSVNGVLITPALFQELAVQPMLGRALVEEDAAVGVEPVAVIGEGLWRRTFGADPEILGRRIDVSGGPVTVVGVQGVGASAPGGRAEIWLPLAMDPRDDDYWKAQDKTLLGVLQPGASLDDGFEDLRAFNAYLGQLFPMFYEPGYGEGEANVQRADEAQRRLIATPLLLLLGGTGLLMLVTALNVGNLLLGRAVDRQRELAVRASLGAGRGRIVRQLLVEGAVLTGLAFTLALLTASYGGPWVARLFVEEAVVASSSVLDATVLGFAATVATLAWVVVNGVPIVDFFRSQRRGLRLGGGGTRRTQRALVTAQAALATLLLVSATLLLGTVDNLRDVPLGFDPEGIVALELSPPEDRVATAADARGLYDRLVEGAATLPGVRAAGLTGWLPLRADAPPTPINLRSDPKDPVQAIRAPMQFVDPGFFEVFGIAATSGRVLSPEDRSSSPTAVVVNESLARLLWPEGNAVGQQIAIDPHAWDAWVNVVGVIPDVRSGQIRGPIGPALYVALAENPSRDLTLVVRAAGNAGGLAAGLRRVVGDVDALVPVRSVSRMEDVVRAAYATSWVMMGLLVALAVLAMGLGAIGIYALLAQHVSSTRREIGVRMALGAEPGAVVGGVVRSGVLLASLGIVLGCVAAAVSSRYLESLLFEVSALAPWAYFAPALTLIVAAVLAAWIPAARAGRLPPSEVLRAD